MVYAISYADDLYQAPMKLCLESALCNGADKVIGYTPADLDSAFVENNSEILNHKRGAGYWLWKPYIIKKTLDKIDYGDYVFYTDAGSVYARNVSSLIEKIILRDEDIVVFDHPYIERSWTKRDAFLLMDCDGKEYSETNQRMATFIVIRKSIKSATFIDEWLKCCMDIRMISDNDNVMGKDNYEGFIDHRHDQSVLSLLSKKRNIIPCPDPSINVQRWFGEKITLSEDQYWLSHKMPYIANLQQLSDACRLFYERYFDKKKKNYIYGAGKIGKELSHIAMYLGVTISGFIVSNKDRITEQEVNGIHVYALDELQYDVGNSKITVAFSGNKDAVINLLKKKKYSFEVLQDFSRDNLIPFIRVACGITNSLL